MPRSTPRSTSPARAARTPVPVPLGRRILLEKKIVSAARAPKGGALALVPTIEAVLCSACSFRRLGVPPHAPREACRKSYLALALRLHPDKCSHPRAKEAFACVEEAFRAVSGAKRAHEA